MNLQGKDNLVKWRKPAFLLSITAMLGGLLFSRVIAVFTGVFLLMETGKSFKKAHKALLLILAISQLVYLHVLAVRTGLICFYVGVFISLIWLVSQHKRKSYLLIFFFLLPITFYFILPTFRNKIHYLKYDLSFVRQHVYQPGSSDDRFASIKAGWILVKQSPVVGVGFGDIKNDGEIL